jgi:hypothetical protein
MKDKSISFEFQDLLKYVNLLKDTLYIKDNSIRYYTLKSKVLYLEDI